MDQNSSAGGSHAVLAGCGSAGQQSQAVGPAVAGGAGDGLRSIARAVVDLSIRTHQGAQSMQGIRVTGTCVSGRIGLTVGHAAPYEPLRKTYIPVSYTHLTLPTIYSV